MVMFRRDVVSRAGGFSAGIDACADYDLYLRISRAWPVAFHDQVVADYRKHGGNMSDNSALMLRQLRSVMRRQRPYLVDPARQEAFREGLRNIRSYYGDRIVMQLRERVRTGRGWGRTLEDVATLAWCHPRGSSSSSVASSRSCRAGMARASRRRRADQPHSLSRG